MLCDFPHIHVEEYCVAIARISQHKEIYAPFSGLLLHVLSHAGLCFGSQQPLINDQLPPSLVVGFTGSTYFIQQCPNIEQLVIAWRPLFCIVLAILLQVTDVQIPVQEEKMRRRKQHRQNVVLSPVIFQTWQ